MSKRYLGLLILTGLLLPVAAKADTEAWDFTTVTGQGNGGTSYALGTLFTPTVNIVVDSLGYYDATNVDSTSQPSLMTQSHRVSLFDVTTGGTLVANTTVTNAGTLVGHFIYESVGPVELFSTDEYELVGVTNTTDFYTNAANVSGFTLSADIVLDGYNKNPGVSAGYDPLNTASAQSFGADLGFEPVPEPSSLLLLGTGLAGLAGMLKRKLMA